MISVAFIYSFLWRFLGPWVPRETAQPLQEREAKPSGAHDQPHERTTPRIIQTSYYIYIRILFN